MINNITPQLQLIKCQGHEMRTPEFADSEMGTRIWNAEYEEEGLHG